EVLKNTSDQTTETKAKKKAHTEKMGGVKKHRFFASPLALDDAIHDVDLGYSENGRVSHWERQAIVRVQVPAINNCETVIVRRKHKRARRFRGFAFGELPL